MYGVQYGVRGYLMAIIVEGFPARSAEPVHVVDSMAPGLLRKMRLSNEYAGWIGG